MVRHRDVRSGCTLKSHHGMKTTRTIQNSWARDNRSAERFQSEIVAESPVPYSAHLCFHISQTSHPAASWGYTKNTTKSPTYMVLIWSCEILWKGCSMNHQPDYQRPAIPGDFLQPWGPLWRSPLVRGYTRKLVVSQLSNLSFMVFHGVSCTISDDLITI